MGSKSTQMVSIDNLSYDVTLTDQVIHLKQAMACPAAGTQSVMWRDGLAYPGVASDYFCNFNLEALKMWLLTTIVFIKHIYIYIL